MNRSDELQQAHDDLAHFRDDAVDEWPRPLNYLVVHLIRQNAQEWLVEKQGTYGEEDIREYGLTENQTMWLNKIAAEMDGGHWICPHCQVVHVAQEKPNECDECESDELFEATVRYPHE